MYFDQYLFVHNMLVEKSGFWNGKKQEGKKKKEKGSSLFNKIENSVWFCERNYKWLK